MHPEDWTGVRRLVVCGGYSPSASLVAEVQQIRVRHPQMAVDLWLAAPTPPPRLSWTERVLFIPNWLAPSVIEQLHQSEFDAAMILTVQRQSPYGIAYACYLAGIPIRVGYSVEFGGGVLSCWIRPPSEPMDEATYHRHLLDACGLVRDGDRPIETRIHP